MVNNMFGSLRMIIQEVNDASDLQHALNVIVQRTRELMHADAVSVYFRDEKTAQLVLMATDGLNQDAIGKLGWCLLMLSRSI